MEHAPPRPPYPPPGTGNDAEPDLATTVAQMRAEMRLMQEKFEQQLNEAKRERNQMDQETMAARRLAAEEKDSKMVRNLVMGMKRHEVVAAYPAALQESNNAGPSVEDVERDMKTYLALEGPPSYHRPPAGRGTTLLAWTAPLLAPTVAG